MIQLKGKYNIANIWIDEIEEGTKSQIQRFLNHPAFQKTYISIMPDCHQGIGSCIGFTMKMNDYIIPNLVGVDLGCSVITYKLGKIDIDFDKLDRFIRTNIPCGFNVRNTRVDSSYLYGTMANLIYQICEKIDQEYSRVMKALGTLGGGNHFIEIDEDPEGNKWLTIHTGSRNFGHKVASFHQNKAKELLEKMFIGDEYKQLEFLPIDKGGQEYLDDMEIAQKYASFNRQIIADIIIYEFFQLAPKERIESVHNYINFEDKIIRKGAISAHKGEKVIIPFNMRDGVLIGTGKGNSAYNYSAPHGAGRVMSRTKAKENLNLDQFKETMQGVYSTTINERTLDEAPGAYKDKNIIIENIKETVDIDFFMKPIYNFKDDTSKRRRRKR